jgi:hypothetical protein
MVVPLDKNRAFHCSSAAGEAPAPAKPAPHDRLYKHYPLHTIAEGCTYSYRSEGAPRTPIAKSDPLDAWLDLAKAIIHANRTRFVLPLPSLTFMT